MRSTVQKWGNSLGVRIPKAIAEAAEVREGSVVEVEAVEGGIVVRPTAPRYELSDLLETLDDDRRLHGEIGTGEPRGREVW